jgi:Domain of unknown function (DUF5664)
MISERTKKIRQARLAAGKCARCARTLQQKISSHTGKIYRICVNPKCKLRWPFTMDVIAPLSPEESAGRLVPCGEQHALPEDPKARKDIPIVRGVLDYFPAALAAVAELSRKGNEQHNPGEPLHHARGKSTDHADCIVRHLMDRGTVDTDGVRHSVKVAWRALALVQEELEAAGAPLARGAKLV